MALKERNFITRLVRTRPLFCAAVLFLSGCIAGYRIDISYPVLFFAVFLLCICLVALRKHRRIAAILLILLMFPLGALRFEAAWDAVSPTADRPNAELTGRICETPVYNPNTQRSICVLDDVSIDSEPMSGRLRLYLRGDVDLLQNPSLAQNVSCTAHIWKADEATNPFQFNFSDYLRSIGIRGYATAEIENASLSGSYYLLRDFPERFRESISTRIERLFPENSSLVKAFLIGDRSEMPDEDRNSFNRAGVAHILAASGLHISMLAGLVSFLLGKILNRRLSFLFTILVLFFYLLITAFPPSLLRAAIMFAIFGYAPLAGRFSDAPTRLSAAMMIHLILVPTDMLSTGFILSYSASAGIIFLTHPLRKLLHTDAFFSRKAPHGIIGFFTHRLPVRILQMIIATLAAQIALYPAVIRYFGSQSVWSFISNLIAVPFAMAGFILSAVGTITALTPIIHAADILLNLLKALVRLLGSLPLSDLRTACFPHWLVLICAAVFLAASDLSKLPSAIRRWLPLFIIPAAMLSNLFASLSACGCGIVFLDAGQADCALIRTEGKVCLVDVGDAYSPAADYIRAMDYSLEAVFLSHPHADHCGGLEKILEYTVPEKIFISKNWDSLEYDEGIPEMLAHAEQLGAQIITVSQGDCIRLSEGSVMKVLAPAAGILDSSANNDSLTLMMEYGQCSALFTGDRQAESMPDPLPDIDILKISHHGAKDGTDAKLLYETTPSVCIIPVGYNNYGHPSPGTMELLGSTDCSVFRTDRNGAVTCFLNRDGTVDIQTSKSTEAVHEVG